MALAGGGAKVIVDLSNLCRDQRFLKTGERADLSALRMLTDALSASDAYFGEVYCVADNSLLQYCSPDDRKSLRRLERDGLLELSAVADERILEMAFQEAVDSRSLVVSMDFFDDFRRTYPSIQGSTDRFLGWEPDENRGLKVFWRDMEHHSHHRLSRKEEAEELNLRRLNRGVLAQRATSTYFRCINSKCMLARFFPEHIPELPKYDQGADNFVCPICDLPLETGLPRPGLAQLIVFHEGAEQFRILLEEGESIAIGRTDSSRCIGLESRLSSLSEKSVLAVSRRHVLFTLELGRVNFADAGSKNGTVLRDLSGSEGDHYLIDAKRYRMKMNHAVVLPCGITVELSGRSLPYSGEQVDNNSQFADDKRLTRISLSSRNG